MWPLELAALRRRLCPAFLERLASIVFEFSVKETLCPQNGFFVVLSLSANWRWRDGGVFVVSRRDDDGSVVRDHGGPS